MFTPAVGGNWSDFENNSFLPEPNRSNPVNIFIPVVAPNYALAIIYWTMFVVGVSGNLLLIYVNAWRRSSKQAATQIFMVSLFVSDLGLLLGATWLTGATSLNPSFYIGRALCKINNLWSILAADGSVIILSIIGLDRYLSLKKPGNCFFSERQAQVLIVSVWVVIVAVNMPLLFWFDLVSFGPSLTICNIVGVNATTLAFYFLFGRTFMFFLPLCITISSYFGIWYKLAFSKRQVGPIDGASGGSAESKLSKKVARMCTLVVAIFTISWTPLEIYLVYHKFAANVNLTLLSRLFILANANSCVNPIIYGFMWKPEKDAFVQMLGRCNVQLRHLKENSSSQNM